MLLRARALLTLSLPILALVLVAALAPVGPAVGAPADGRRTAPEGGPVDDGWLPGPAVASFAQFSGEPAPGGPSVWPGVRLDTRGTTLADGNNVDVQVLHLDPDADVQVRPTLAGGSVRGLGTVASQSGDPLRGAVAATNGGFWLPLPLGEPNGYFTIDGRLVSDAETQGAGPRGTVGWTADGRVLVDRIDTTETLTLADGSVVVVDGINRGHREYDQLFADGVDSVLAFTPDYGGGTTVDQPAQPPPPPPAEGEPPVVPDPPDPVDLAILRLQAPVWPASGEVAATVIGITRDEEARVEPGPGEVLVAGTGAGAVALDGVQVGDTLVLGTAVRALDPARDDDWATVTRGLAGGPMIVKDGHVTDPADWVDEGFEPHVHSDVRAPRTAIGVTADGRTLMVVADGRRPGITHGFTIAELGQYMIALGAVEAVSLDGGGSSQMVVDGVLRNVPCCDSSTRPVATSLQVVHAYSFTAPERLQGGGRVDTAAAVARATYPQGARTAVLAAAGSFPDALAGGPLAAALGAPVLLTERDTIPQATLDAMADLGVGEVVLLGGDAVIAPEVAQQLAVRSMAARRVAGDSRFDTAAAIAAQLVGGAPVARAFLVPAGTFPDALLAAGPGGMLGMPVLLTDTGSLHPAARRVLSSAAEVVVVDADGQLAPSVIAEVESLGATVRRIGGGGRYATSVQVADWVDTQVPLAPEVVVARGGTFPDALAGGPLAARRQVPLVLVPTGGIDEDPTASAWFRGRGITRATILGGPAAVSSFTQWQLDTLALG